MKGLINKRSFCNDRRSDFKKILENYSFIRCCFFAICLYPSRIVKNMHQPIIGNNQSVAVIVPNQKYSLIPGI